MGVFASVLFVLGILILIEGLIIIAFPNWSMKSGRRMFKNKQNIKKFGIIEIIVAIVLILIGMNI